MCPDKININKHYIFLSYYFFIQDREIKPYELGYICPILDYLPYG